jgi:hypothetical protein
MRQGSSSYVCDNGGYKKFELLHEIKLGYGNTKEKSLESKYA